MTTSNDGKHGEVLNQFLRAWKSLCQTTICTTLICLLLIHLVALRLIQHSLIPLLARSLMMVKSTILNTSIPTEAEHIHDIATRKAVLRLKQAKDHDHDLQSCYYWYAHENFDFEAAAARLRSESHHVVVSQKVLEVEPATASTQTGVFPAEIWHLICGKLEHIDLISLRSTNRGLADIAAEYLIRTIYLDTSFESFARLQEIASHPLLRKGVTKLIFEAGLLGDVGCIHNYSRHFDLQHHADFKPRPPSQNDQNDQSERAKRLHSRNMVKFEKALEEKYLAYRKVFEAQQLLLEGPKDHLVDCMEGLFNLEEIILQTEGCSHMMSSRFRDKYLNDCAISMDRQPSHTVWQLEKVLRPGAPLKRLTARQLSPNFFDVKGNRSLEWLQASFKDLELLRLSFKQDYESNEADEEALEPIGSRMLKNTQLSQVLRSAVHLKNLTINFSGAERVACKLTEIMPGLPHSFPQLSILDLNFFEASEDELLQVLKAQPKLYGLTLAFTILTEGCWASLVRRLRNDLKLGTCWLEGILEDPSGLYSTDMCDRDMWATEHDIWNLSMALDLHITDMMCDYAASGFDDEEDFDLCCNPIRRYADDFADEEDLTFEFGPIYSDSEGELKDSGGDDESVPDLEEGPTSPMSLD